MWKTIIGFIPRYVQVKISFIGFNHGQVFVLGNPFAQYKIAEVSVALLTFGVRLTVRV